MKKLFTFLTALIILSACKKEGDFDSKDFPQTFELVTMVGNIANAKPRTGNDLPYKENYSLNENSTFVKTRIRNEITETAYGTFTVKKIDSNSYFVFKYSTKNNLIGNCGGLEEHLVIESSNSINNNWWQACDGPALEYKRVE